MGLEERGHLLVCGLEVIDNVEDGVLVGGFGEGFGSGGRREGIGCSFVDCMHGCEMAEHSACEVVQWV